MSAFQPSPYQAAILDFVTSGRGDGIVNAVAGAGKTTTLVQAARLISAKSALFVAFNKHIAETLQTKLAGTTMTAKTVHSIGYGCVAAHLGTRLRVDDRKYTKIVRDWIDDNCDNWPASDDPPTLYEASSQLRDLVAMCRLTLTDPSDREAIRETADRYGLDYHRLVVPGVAAVLRRGERLARERSEIDYTDMLWLPHVWGLTPPQVDWLMADEIQDFSEAQLQLLLKCRAPGGRGLWVGDPQQAIMGFAYAGTDSYTRIRAATGATELPLSICYRCPTSHLALARTIVPHIEARPDAPAGLVDYVSDGQISKQVKEGDLILCRLTAPLIGLCIRLISQRVPARVRGRDIARALTEIVRQIADMPGFEWDHFPKYLEERRRQQIAKLAKREGNEAAIESLNDRLDGVLACYEAFDAIGPSVLCSEIEGLFSDERASVWLSTVHRAKGLENPRVFILKPDKLPLTYPNQTPEQAQQERHLRYVALTRAQESLYFVGERPAPPPAPEAPPAATEADRKDGQ